MDWKQRHITQIHMNSQEFLSGLRYIHKQRGDKNKSLPFLSDFRIKLGEKKKTVK